ncbi:MAG: heme-binding protein [Chitinophagales bacterium]
MQPNERLEIINKIILEFEKLIPEALSNPKDEAIANGNVAICIIDEAGAVHGRMFGNNKPRQRQSFKVAWTKASQVWLTGVRTGEYERLVFTNQIPENSNGIENPDLIGWVGGQPLHFNNGLQLSVGCSGFRGETDIEIVLKACKNLKLI